MRFGKILTAATAIAIAIQLTPQTVICADNNAPLLWYDFADGAKDVSGNNLHGTVNGITEPVYPQDKRVVIESASVDGNKLNYTLSAKGDMSCCTMETAYSKALRKTK